MDDNSMNRLVTLLQRTLHVHDVQRCHPTDGIKNGHHALCRVCWIHIIVLLRLRLMAIMKKTQCIAQLTVTDTTLKRDKPLASSSTSTPRPRITLYQLNRLISMMATQISNMDAAFDQYNDIGAWHMISGRTICFRDAHGESIVALKEGQVFFANYEPMLHGSQPMLMNCLQLSAIIILTTAQSALKIEGYQFNGLSRSPKNKPIPLARMGFYAVTDDEMTSIITKNDIIWRNAVF